MTAAAAGAGASDDPELRLAVWAVGSLFANLWLVAFGRAKGGVLRARFAFASGVAGLLAEQLKKRAVGGDAKRGATIFYRQPVLAGVCRHTVGADSDEGRGEADTD